jgi:hypothetical protein
MGKDNKSYIALCKKVGQYIKESMDIGKHEREDPINELHACKNFKELRDSIKNIREALQKKYNKPIEEVSKEDQEKLFDIIEWLWLESRGTVPSEEYFKPNPSPEGFNKIFNHLNFLTNFARGDKENAILNIAMKLVHTLVCHHWDVEGAIVYAYNLQEGMYTPKVVEGNPYIDLSPKHQNFIRSLKAQAYRNNNKITKNMFGSAKSQTGKFFENSLAKLNIGERKILRFGEERLLITREDEEAFKMVLIEKKEDIFAHRLAKEGVKNFRSIEGWLEATFKMAWAYMANLLKELLGPWMKKRDQEISPLDNPQESFPHILHESCHEATVLLPFDSLTEVLDEYEKGVKELLKIGNNEKARAIVSSIKAFRDRFGRGSDKAKEEIDLLTTLLSKASDQESLLMEKKDKEIRKEKIDNCLNELNNKYNDLDKLLNPKSTIPEISQGKPQ